MKIAALLATLLALPASAVAQDQNDTHRLTLKNGEIVDCVVLEKSDAGLSVRYTSCIEMFVKWSEIKTVELLRIRALGSDPKKVDAPVEPPKDPSQPATAKQEPKARVVLPRIPFELEQKIEAIFVRAAAIAPEELTKKLRGQIVQLGSQALRYVSVRMELLPNPLVRYVGEELVLASEGGELPDLRTEIRQRLESERSVVRRIAIDVVIALKDAVFAPTLVRMLADTDAGVRGAAIIALSVVGDDSALERIARLVRDADRSVRRQSALTANELARRSRKQAELLAVWQPILRSGSAIEREEIAGAMATMAVGLAPLEDVGTPARTQVEQILIGLSTDRETSVRSVTAGSLAELGTARAKETLVERLRAESDVTVKVRVLQAISKSRDKKAVGALINELSSMDALVKDAAWKALKAITGQSKLPADRGQWEAWYKTQR